jgi:D-alanyl-D-alanine dipeptidase
MLLPDCIIASCCWQLHQSSFKTTTQVTPAPAIPRHTHVTLTIVRPVVLYACRVAREKQQQLLAMTPEQRQATNKRYGYADVPRVAMVWRIAGQHLRTLKVLRPLLQQQAVMQQQLQQGRRLQIGSMQHPYLASYVAAAGKQKGGRQRDGAAAEEGDGAAAAGQMQGLHLR